MEEDLLMEGQTKKETQVAPALISVHPLDKCIALAVGSELRVYNLEEDCPVSLSDDIGDPSHTDTIRVICFGANGRLFASAGDDKLVKIWKTDSWTYIANVYSEKRVSTVAISHDGLFVTFADKFGVVWIYGLEDCQSKSAAHKKAVTLLSHYCSIITSLKISPDGQFIASADRDFKIRITVFPKEPMIGAHEIQSFCLGHADFVSCLAFICPMDYQGSLLLSGGGDATVKLWDHVSGCLIDSCYLGKTAGLHESNEKMEYPAVTDIQANPDGSLIAVSVQGLHGVIFLRCDVAARILFIAKIVLLEESFVPTSLGLGSSAKLLWMAMGASNVPTLGVSHMVWLRALSGLDKVFSDAPDICPFILDDRDVPCGTKLLLKLQGSVDVAKQEEALVAISTAVNVAMKNLLTKKQYSFDTLEMRKRDRNDRKMK
ncbi:hypothetical protein HPP92_005854 [Vanilla planifolia]|uniref:tRNA (guanine-N(7)-)-methyltransferase non-catalytic subunit n=1 Tax=Vanilla planifolia TaxID=51239 RepID=A0A835VF98_VANPL|nr:hypothetical protein HPP92_005854 [Vanilla planifolia]